MPAPADLIHPLADQWVVVIAATQQVGIWIIFPTLVMLVAAVAAAPLWPWSRGWGWPISGMFGVAAMVAAVFTIGWLFS